MLLCLVCMYSFLIQLCFTLQFKLWIGPLLCLRGVIAFFYAPPPCTFSTPCINCFFCTHHPWTVHFNFYLKYCAVLFSKWCSDTVYPFHDKFKSAFGIYLLLSYRQKKFPGFILIFPIWVFSMKSAQNYVL